MLQLVLHIESHSWLSGEGLRHSMLQAWGKGLIWFVVVVCLVFLVFFFLSPPELQARLALPESSSLGRDLPCL